MTVTCRKYYKHASFKLMNSLILDSKKRQKANIQRQSHDRHLLQWSYRISFDVNDTSYKGHRACTRLQKFKNYLNDTYVKKDIDLLCTRYTFVPRILRIKYIEAEPKELTTTQILSKSLNLMKLSG